MELSDMLAQAAQKGARLGNLGPMCSDCAFKPQPDINGYSEAVHNAAGALVMGGVFHCHTPQYADTGAVCKGFLYAQQYFDHLDKQAYDEKETADAQRSTDGTGGSA